MAYSSYGKFHPQFLRKLRMSHADVDIICRVCRRRGLWAISPPIFEAKTQADAKDCADHGDFFALGVKAGRIEVQKFEVKGLEYDFTSIDDWPFRHLNQIYVCPAANYDRAEIKPHAFFYLNKARTHFALLRTDTYKTWWIQDVISKDYHGIPIPTYTCSPKLCNFIKID